MDGIPLAIELAAARVNLLSVEELTERLNERFRIFMGGNARDYRASRRCERPLSGATNCFSTPERRLFERLSVFVGGCTLAAAEAVAPNGELRRPTSSISCRPWQRKSLVVVDRNGSDSRYRLLESTRAFALEKLVENGDGSARERHASWMVAVADRAAESSLAKPVEDWVREFQPELENARTAIEWAIQCDEVSVGARIACGLTEVWRATLGYAEPRRWLELLLSRIDGATNPAATARILQTLSSVTLACIASMQQSVRYSSIHATVTRAEK